MARRQPVGRPSSLGQVLVLFVLFLLVLLGVSALAIDYASWLLTDRNLQNVSDHAALAGASEFDDRTIASANCQGGLGQPHCNDARKQAWASLSNELGLNLSSTMISCLATVDSGDPGVGVGDSPLAGETDTSRASGGACTAEAVVDFDGRTIWVATPPPNDGAYTNFGGRYSQNYGIVWVRVDQPVRSFLGGALGITPNDRSGWATAGALPADFALETFCRNSIAPESGVCVNSAGVTVDGQGGIRLLRGDIGSNESLTITAATGNGAILETGNMFLVNRVCAASTWSCPGNPQDPYGGIVNMDPSLAGATMKNAFYMAPLPVPEFQSPVDGVDHSANCTASDVATTLCVPWAGQNSTLDSPGDWTCSPTSSTPIRCGAPTITTDLSGNSTVECVGQGGGNPGNHYYPNGVASGASGIQGDASHPKSNGDEWQNIDDSRTVPDPDADGTPENPPVDWVYTDNINTSGGASASFIVNIAPSGPRVSGTSTIRYVVFKTNAGIQSNTGNVVTVTARLLPASGTTAIATDVVRTLTDVPTEYSFTTGTIPAAQFNSLRLQFTFNTTTTTGATADRRGGGVSWAGVEHPDPQPTVAPMIPPGYYESIEIPDDSCAVMDPTGEYSGLKAYQMPGIYQFGGDGGTNDWKIKLGTGAFLIGDGVTLVFDADWPDSGSNKGVATSADSALVLNTMRVPTVLPAPCTPTETETSTVNESAASLGLLEYSAVCAAWGVDTTVTSGVRPGGMAWPVCTTSGTTCINRLTDYDPIPNYRGITFYFTPDPGWGTAHASMNTRNRFEMQGTDAGLAFRGVLYAPYDDVKISGGNGFRTVGQVLSWTVKFNGGSAFIDLDYPYPPTAAQPYLLEPTVER